MPKTTINDLPEEILGLIFEETIGHDKYVTPSFQCGSRNAPWNIFSVCKYWRYTLVHRLSIWTSLTCDETDASVSPPSLHSMNVWICHTDTMPLRLQLREVGYPVGYSNACDMLKLYGHYSKRIRSLDLHLEEDAIVGLRDLLLDTCFPSLEELHINVHPMVQPDYFGGLCSAVHTLRALRHLMLTQDDVYPRIIGNVTSVLPWTQLHTLDLRMTVSLEHAARIVKECTSATSVTLQAITTMYPLDEAGESEDTAILVRPKGSNPEHALPCLKNLTLEGHDSPLPLLDVFKMPNLETLTVTSKRAPRFDYWPLSNLVIHAQDRFVPTLREVTLLNQYTCSPEDVFSFVRGTRALARVPDVSVAYGDITLRDVRELNYLIDVQVTFGERGFPDSNHTINPAPAQLMVWNDRRAKEPTCLNIHIGWSYTMGDLRYDPLAYWDEEGIVTPMGKGLKEAFASARKSAPPRLQSGYAREDTSREVDQYRPVAYYY